MKKRDERYCVNGHDVTKVGRRKGNNGCNECIRIRQRLYMRAFRAGKVFKGTQRLLPKQPLVDAIRAAAPRYATSKPSDRGYLGLSAAYAGRYPDTTMESADRMIHRLISDRSKRVEEETADRWCILLGIHPIELWPTEWPLMEAEV